MFFLQVIQTINLLKKKKKPCQNIHVTAFVANDLIYNILKTVLKILICFLWTWSASDSILNI